VQDETKYPLLLRIAGMKSNYFIKTPWWLKRFYPHRIWDKAGETRSVYLSFDDGPEPMVTPFVLDELKKYNATATFFCIGENVASHPGLYQRIINEGHTVGNHTMHHLNGWKTSDPEYLDDIVTAGEYIRSDLFRPPYGRISSSQARKLKKQLPAMKIIMWDVLSGDFDETCTPEQCLENVKKNAGPGSIVVFHDSIKAGDKLKQVLPQILSFLSEKGFSFQGL
jgi:peptidoglycan/xylan/chitin deacetylase (PgdA/CDA1 family)